MKCEKSWVMILVAEVVGEEVGVEEIAEWVCVAHQHHYLVPLF